MKRWLFAVLALVVLGLAAACGGDDGADGDDQFGKTPGAETPAGEPTEGAPTVSTTPEIPFAEACQKTEEKQFSAAPPLIIDSAKTYLATIKTAKGDVVVELFTDTPITTNNFVFLSCKGYYDGVTFHRVLPGFVAQGGDPTGTGSGGPGYAIPDEDDGDHTFDAPGVISMAKAGPNTTGSQFFITYAPTPNLEPDFTVFGKLVSGMDVLQQITPRDPAANPNAPPGDVIETITIEER
jgi:cyclophilin family peptidyl-prolyl cis-trans isomerase